MDYQDQINRMLALQSMANSSFDRAQDALTEESMRRGEQTSRNLQAAAADIAPVVQALALASIAESLAKIEEHLGAVALWVNMTGPGN